MKLRRPLFAGLLTATITLLVACNSSSPTAPASSTAELDISICAAGAAGLSADISNPFFPLRVGARWVLEGREDGALVRLEITALPETERIDGVATRVVVERETRDGALVEVSRNFFAQTADGSVCYYGEEVDIYEQGVVVSHAGAWRAGGGNQPGIFMPGSPRVGQDFRQELAPGVAVDEATVVAAGERVVVPLGTFTDTIRIQDRNPLDGGTGEKIYARGTGLLVDGDVRRLE